MATLLNILLQTKMHRLHPLVPHRQCSETTGNFLRLVQIRLLQFSSHGHSQLTFLFSQYLLSHIVLHFYQSIQCGCGCASLAQHLKSLVNIFFFDNIFHLHVHYVCLLVQHFEPQGRCFTNFRCYYSQTWSTMPYQYVVCV